MLYTMRPHVEEGDMTPDDVLKKYGTKYRFHKETQMAASSLGNWVRWGYVPMGAQLKLERITKGELKADWIDKDE